MQRLAEDGLIERQPGPRQLRRRAAGAPPREPADDVHPGDAAPRPVAEFADARPRDPPVDRRRGGRPRHPSRRAGRPPAPAALRRRRADRDRDGAAAPPHGAERDGRGSRARARCTRRSPAAGTSCGAGRRRSRPPRPPPRTRACSGIRPGDPLLVERRVIADAHGRRIEATESRLPGRPLRARRAVRGRGRDAIGAWRSHDRGSRAPGGSSCPTRRRRPDHDRGRLDHRDRTGRRRRPAAPFIAPGFVDVHVHGWGGHDAMGDADALTGMARALLRHGVTSFLPTAPSAPRLGAVAVRRAGPGLDPRSARTTARSRWGSTSRARSSRRPGRAPTTRPCLRTPGELGADDRRRRSSTGCG